MIIGKSMDCHMEQRGTVVSYTRSKNHPWNVYWILIDGDSEPSTVHPDRVRLVDAGDAMTWKLTKAQASVASCVLAAWDCDASRGSLDGRTLSLSDDTALDEFLGTLESEMHCDHVNGIPTRAGENLRDVLQTGEIDRYRNER